MSWNTFDWRGATYSCETQVVEGPYVLVRCDFADIEGIWSTTESGSYRAWTEEHADAHVREADRRSRPVPFGRGHFQKRLPGLRYSG